MDPNRIKERPPPPPPGQAEAPRPDPAKGPSRFQSMLQQARVVQQMPSFQSSTDSQQRAPEERRKERAKVHERTTDRAERDEDDTETRAERPTTEGGSGLGVRGRMVQRAGQQREQRGHGQRDGGGHAGQGGSHGSGERAARTGLSRDSGKARTVGAAAEAAQLQAEAAAAADVPKQLDRQQLQRLVNTLVQAIRVGKNVIGEDELHLTFQAHVFRGLRLRLQAKDGRVTLNFVSADPRVRALFQGERQQISAALQAKGIYVAGIHVMES